MWDTHIHRTKTAPSYPQTITEVRAPTDDSIRLVREIEEKARDSVILAIKGSASSFQFRAVVWEEYAIRQLRLRVNFTLNESAHDIEIMLPDSWREKNRDEWLIKIRDMISERMATHIIVTVCRDSVLQNKLSKF